MVVDEDKLTERGVREALEQAAGAGSAEQGAGQSAAGQAGIEAPADWREQLTALRDEVLRARAEADNVRKRAVRDVEAAHKYGLERLVAELLPVRDSLDAGLLTAATADSATLRDGITLTRNMLVAALAKFEVIELDPLGEKFNPEQHQAMTMQDDPVAEPGTILRVMQKGYLLHDRLVRPAMVVVARRALEAQA